MKKKYDCIKETLEHIEQVKHDVAIVCDRLTKRAEAHDRTKIEEPELSYFNKYTPMLAKLKYGSKEYDESLKGLEVALDHHYKMYRHHPQHFENGVNDMNIIDILEMFCDWNSASKRMKDGSLEQSIEVGRKRFKLDNVNLTKIFENSLDIFERKENVSGDTRGDSQVQ